MAGAAQILLGAGGVAAFVAVLFGLTLVLPGPVHEGAPRPDGGRPSYRLNGLAIFALVMVAAAACQAAGWSLGVLARNFWPLCLGANLLAFAAAAVLLLLGREPRQGWLRGYFYGRDRDPTLLGVDLKLFSYRPSLIGLALINLSFAALQIETEGRLSLAMAAYQAMTLLYIANYFQFEHGMLFTWDIIEERFGWMLVWGDYVLVPFFYCLPAIFLARPQPPLPAALVAALVLLYLLGFWLFRGANQQKHDFKRDPATRIWGRPAETLEGRLLVSGFWGIGRKLNYAGELTMYVAWTALAGIASPWPWLLPAWLGTLLVHRAWRDEQRCRRKYGALWDAYCRRARFRMIPFVY
jgi:delta14-sterol reductase